MLSNVEGFRMLRGDGIYIFFFSYVAAEIIHLSLKEGNEYIPCRWNVEFCITSLRGRIALVLKFWIEASRTKSLQKFLFRVFQIRVIRNFNQKNKKIRKW